jgi:multisubunit Na+/H+ antiporter MnhG subunit
MRENRQDTTLTLETDIMAHNPVNHPLRPIYRALGALTGAYLVLFGILGAIVTADKGLFGNGEDRVLGQETNLFWSIVCVLIGAIVLIATVMGRNADTTVDRYFGWGLLVVGSYELAVIRTDANFLNFSVSTVVVTYLLGLVLIMAAYYSKVAPQEQTGAPRQVREREAQSA